MNTAELYTKLRSEFGTGVYKPEDVQEMLLLSNRDLENYESEIIRLKSQILYVESQKKRLHDYRVKLRSLLSPVRQLPNETLGLIFGFACNQNFLQQYPWLDWDNPSPTKLSSPLFRHLPTLAISTVCKRWRTLAVSSPGLWSTISLEILMHDAAPVMFKGRVAILERYLERSANWPLSIELAVLGDSEEDEHVFLISLIQHSQRWKSFRYRGNFTLSRHQGFLQTSFPLLEELDLMDLLGHRRVAVENLRCFRDAPKLVALVTNAPPKVIKESGLPLNQLTFVDTVSSKREQMGDILDFCSNIVTLKVWQRTAMGAYSNLSVNSQTISKKVSSLTLRFCRYEEEGDFLEAVFASYTLPALTQLHVEAKDPPCESEWPKDEFTKFIARSQCSITSFSLHRLGISDLDVISVLQVLPSLLTFSINDDNVRWGESPITSRLISHLHSSDNDDQSSSSPSLLPKLRSLSLNVGGAVFDDAAFVDMVSSRWLPDPEYAEVVGVACLRSVVLHFRHREVDRKIYEPLDCLDKMGMQVVIT